MARAPCCAQELGAENLPSLWAVSQGAGRGLRGAAPTPLTMATRCWACGVTAKTLKNKGSRVRTVSSGVARKIAEGVLAGTLQESDGTPLVLKGEPEDEGEGGMQMLMCNSCDLRVGKMLGLLAPRGEDEEMQEEEMLGHGEELFEDEERQDEEMQEEEPAVPSRAEISRLAKKKARALL